MQCLSVLPTDPIRTPDRSNRGVQQHVKITEGWNPAPTDIKTKKTNRQRQTKTVRQQDHKRTLLEYNGKRCLRKGHLSTDPSYKRFATKMHKNKHKQSRTQRSHKRSKGESDRTKRNGRNTMTETTRGRQKQKTRRRGTSKIDTRARQELFINNK